MLVSTKRHSFFLAHIARSVLTEDSVTEAEAVECLVSSGPLADEPSEAVGLGVSGEGTVVVDVSDGQLDGGVVGCLCEERCVGRWAG